MKNLYFLIVALLAITGNANAMQARNTNTNTNIHEDQPQEMPRVARTQHNNFKTQILATFDKENGRTVNLPQAYNRFNAWCALFTSDLNPQNLKTEFKNLQTTYTIFARALSRDTTQQTNLAQLQQNIQRVGHLVNGSASVVTNGNAANTNNNLQ